MYTGVHNVHGAQLQHWVGNKHTGYETNKYTSWLTVLLQQLGKMCRLLQSKNL